MRTWIVTVILLAASSAWADFSDSRRFDTADVRAMGGVSIASGSPAAAAIGDTNFSVLGLVADIRGNLSGGFASYGWIRDTMGFRDNMGNLSNQANLLAQRDKLAALAARIPSASDLEGHVDIARFQIGNRRVGQFLFGAYAEGFAGVRLSLPPPDRIGTSGMSIALGQDTVLLTAAGMGDAGGRFGYGRMFGLPRGMSLAGGAHVRVFHRWLARPYRIGVDAAVSGADSFHVPGFHHETGIGGAVDLSSILALNDRILDARIGLEINGIGATGYAGGTSREAMDFAMGGIVRPLNSIGFRRWEVGTELHAFEDGRPSWHVGSSITWGGQQLNVSPRIGGIVGDRGVFGETRHAFTAGFSATLGPLQLAGVAELYRDGYDIGIRLALGN